MSFHHHFHRRSFVLRSPFPHFAVFVSPRPCIKIFRPMTGHRWYVRGAKVRLRPAVSQDPGKLYEIPASESG